MWVPKKQSNNRTNFYAKTSCYKYEIPTHMIEYIRLYNSVDRNELLNALIGYEIPTKLCRLVKMTLENSVKIVKANGGPSDDFKVLFNIAQEELLRDCRTKRRGTL